MTTIEGQQTYLIECNRTNSIIDQDTPEDQNATWVNRCNIQVKRGDRIGLEMACLESDGVQGNVIEFTGNNIVQNNIEQPFTDDCVVLEIGFYVNNNGDRTINLPIRFEHNVNGGAAPAIGALGRNLKVNKGTYAQPLAAGVDNGFSAYQYPGCSYPLGLAGNVRREAGFNYQVGGGQQTAFDVLQFLDINGAALPLPLAAGTQIKSIVLSKATDPGLIGLSTEYDPYTAPLPVNWNCQGTNVPFQQGMLLIVYDNSIGNPPENFGTIQTVEANMPLGVADGRVIINLVDIYENTAPFNVHSLAITSCHNPLPTPKRFGYSKNPFNAVLNSYSKGSRLGLGLYNMSAPPETGNAWAGMEERNARFRGGGMLWEATRVWGQVAATELPALGCSTTTTKPPPFNGSRGLKTLDYRRYRDNGVYVAVAPNFQGAQATENGQGETSKLQPMVAYIMIKAPEAFTDCIQLADLITQALHSVNPLITNEGPQIQKYINDNEYPFNKNNNVIPLTSTGYFSYSEGVVPTGWIVGFSNRTAALWNRIEPLFIGPALKCLPANLTTGIDWAEQTGNPYVYLPSDEKDYLKVGGGSTDQQGWNWCNLIYGNMFLKNFQKCKAGDRFIRLECDDMNRLGQGPEIQYRDIPSPVVLNHQLREKVATEPGSNYGVPNPFEFTGTQINRFEIIFTNILYTEENLDDIEIVFREAEKYQTDQVGAKNTWAEQQKSPLWTWEADIGMANGEALPNKFNDDDPQWAGKGLMEPLQTNFINAPPNSAQIGPYPSAAPIIGGVRVSQICPSQTFPGMGGEINLQQARDCGRILVYSRWWDSWDNLAAGIDIPLNPLEDPALGANCQIYNGATFIYDATPSKQRNIGALPYRYTDSNGDVTVTPFTCFVVAKTYDPQTPTVVSGNRRGSASWQLGRISYNDLFGFSQQYGYDQPAVIPVNSDSIHDPNNLDPGGASPAPPSAKWRWNNINYNWIGAADSIFEFDLNNNRFQFKNLYTPTTLSTLSAIPVAAGSTPTPAIPQVGEVMATFNTDQTGNLDFYGVDEDRRPAAGYVNIYNNKNQGVQDAICGIYLNKMYLPPPGWNSGKFNPQNLYNPYSGYNNETGDYRSYLDKTVEDKKEFLSDLTECTAANYSGTLFDKMGFDYEQLFPNGNGNTENRYNVWSYGKTSLDLTNSGKKPFMLNSEMDTAQDLALNVFSYNTGIGYPTSASDSNGTPLYNTGLLNNNPINVGNVQSAALTANRIPTFFSAPFYLIYSDICPTQFQSGSVKQSVISVGMKNYSAGSYFYIYSTSYTQVVDTDRTITQIRTSIKNPITNRLARLGKNSCVIYKIIRNISLPPIGITATGEIIPEEEPLQLQEKDDLGNILKEIKKLIVTEKGPRDPTLDINPNPNNNNNNDNNDNHFINNLREHLRDLNEPAAHRVRDRANMDFGGLRRLEEKQEESKRNITMTVEEKQEAQQESKEQKKNINIEDIRKDIIGVIVEKALKSIPLTKKKILNPVLITTGIRNVLEKNTQNIEKWINELIDDKKTIDDIVREIGEENIRISVKGKILTTKKGGGLADNIKGSYQTSPEVIAAITRNYELNGGEQIANIVEQAIDENDIRHYVSGSDDEPLTQEELKKAREDAKSDLKKYKHIQYILNTKHKGKFTRQDLLLGYELARDKINEEYAESKNDEGKEKALKKELKLVERNPGEYLATALGQAGVEASVPQRLREEEGERRRRRREEEAEDADDEDEI